MIWFDDDLGQESLRVNGTLYTVYMTSPRHEWTAIRTLHDGSMEWCGKYFPSRAMAKSAALVAVYVKSSVPGPELNEAIVRVLEKKQAEGA